MPVSTLQRVPSINDHHTWFYVPRSKSETQPCPLQIFSSVELRVTITSVGRKQSEGVLSPNLTHLKNCLFLFWCFVTPWARVFGFLHSLHAAVPSSSTACYWLHQSRHRLRPWAKAGPTEVTYATEQWNHVIIRPIVIELWNAVNIVSAFDQLFTATSEHTEACSLHC